MKLGGLLEIGGRVILKILLRMLIIVVGGTRSFEAKINVERI